MSLFWTSKPESDPDDIKSNRARYQEWLEEYKRLFEVKDRNPLNSDIDWTNWDRDWAKKAGILLD